MLAVDLGLKLGLAYFREPCLTWTRNYNLGGIGISSDPQKVCMYA